jgi:hypothetical protein
MYLNYFTLVQITELKVQMRSNIFHFGCACLIFLILLNCGFWVFESTYKIEEGETNKGKWKLRKKLCQSIKPYNHQFHLLWRRNA